MGATFPWLYVASLIGRQQQALRVNGPSSQRLLRNLWSSHFPGSTGTELHKEVTISESEELPVAAASLTKPQVPGTTKSLSDILQSIQNLFQCVGPVSLGDIAFGLQVVARQHVEQKVKDHLSGQVIHDTATISALLDDLDLAHACYLNKPQTACAYSQLKYQNMKRWRGDAGRLQPAYYIAVDHTACQVVWAIRGTHALGDLLTDLCGTSHPYGGGFTHWGILHSADWFIDHELKFVSQLLRRHPSYGLHLVGHSLGGGVAALLAHIIRSGEHRRDDVWDLVDPQQTYVDCVTFGSAGVFTSELAASCRDFVTSVVYNDDIVPRINLDTVGKLRAELEESKWYEKMKDWVMEHEYVQGITQAFDTVDRTLTSFQRQYLSNTPLNRVSLALDGALKSSKDQFAPRLTSLQDAAIKEWISSAVAAYTKAEPPKGQDLVNAARHAVGAVADTLGNLGVKEATERLMEATGLSSGTDNGISRQGRMAMQSWEQHHEGDGGSDDQIIAFYKDLLRESAFRTGAEGSNERHEGPSLDAGLGGTDRDSTSGASVHTLHPAGRLLYLRREAQGSSPSHTLLDVPPGQTFQRIVLSQSSLRDHRCFAYRKALTDLYVASVQRRS